MGKVDGSVQGLGDPFVFRSPRAMVQRERIRPVPERPEERHGRLSEGGGGKPRQDREQGIARPAFHGGDEDPRVPRPDPAQAFHEGQPGLEADPMFQVSPRLRQALALVPLPLAEKRPIKHPPGLPVLLEVLVDPLVADRPLAFPAEIRERLTREGQRPISGAGAGATSMLQSVEYCAAGWFVQGYAGSGDNLRDGLMEAVEERRCATWAGCVMHRVWAE